MYSTKKFTLSRVTPNSRRFHVFTPKSPSHTIFFGGPKTKAAPMITPANVICSYTMPLVPIIVAKFTYKAPAETPPSAISHQRLGVLGLRRDGCG